MTTQAPDTSVVSLVRIAESLLVTAVNGRAWHVPESRRNSLPLAVGMRIAVGDTVALAAGTDIRLGALSLSGGTKGTAFAFVRDDAFRPSKTRADVPRILAELDRISDDDLPAAPAEACAQAAAAEFAKMNLTLDGAQELSRETARRQGAVCLFISEETAFVAFSRLTVARLRAIVQALERPVQPHLVPEDVVHELFFRVYGERA